MRGLPRLGLAFCAAAIAAGCEAEAPPTLVLRMSSDLAIGSDTNAGTVRVRIDDTLIRQAAFDLGDGERTAWPQTLPVVAGTLRPDEIGLEIELQWTSPGQPSTTVGYVELTSAFPSRGTAFVDIAVPRACEDGDDDGYGIGFGCEEPDCDDSNPDVPRFQMCPGATADCLGQMCETDQTCFMGECVRQCTENADCPEVQLGCFQQMGVCICRRPCTEGTNSCAPLECRDGCCQP